VNGFVRPSRRNATISWCNRKAQARAILALVRDDPHHFELDLDWDIGTHLVEQLEVSPALPVQTGVAPAASGIYALYYRNLVYLGKATMTMTSKRTLRGCLNGHVDKIASRENICDLMIKIRNDRWVRINRRKLPRLLLRFSECPSNRGKSRGSLRTRARWDGLLSTWRTKLG
jgi:hypothetical protein